MSYIEDLKEAVSKKDFVDIKLKNISLVIDIEINCYADLMCLLWSVAAKKELVSKNIKKLYSKKKYWDNIAVNAKKVSCITNGVPLHVLDKNDGREILIKRLDDDKTSAIVYTNAEDNRYFCLKIFGCGNKGESFRGKKWKNKKSCIKAAKKWVSLKKIPQINGG